MIPKRAIIDSCCLILLISIINIISDREHFGWMDFMPSPYFLIPIIIAAFHGMYSGLSCALLTFFVIAAYNAYTTTFSFAEYYYVHFYELFCFILSAGLVAEIKGYHRKENVKLNEILELKSVKLNDLNQQLNNVVEINQNIQKQLLNQNKSSVSLDLEIRKLFQSPNDMMYENFLILLNRIEQIETSAIYVQEKDKTYRQLCSLNHDFPEFIKMGEVTILEMASESQQLVSVIEVVASRPDHNEPYLLAVPMIPSGSRKTKAFLLVKDMSFINYNKRTMRRIYNICRWSIDIINMKFGESSFQYRIQYNKQIFYSDFLWSKLDIAIEGYERNSLDTTILLLWAENTTKNDLFLEGVLKPIRSGDYPIHLPVKKSHLCIFLPLTGKRGAEILLKRCGECLKEISDIRFNHTIIEIKDFTNPQEVREFIDNDLSKKI